MMKRLAILAAVIFFGIGVHAQAITIDNANIPAGPYGQGSNIAIPIDISGCFAVGNTFELYISGDNFASEQLIGSFNNYFTTFVNGTIPAGLAPGSYTFRVKSTNPAITSAATISSFSIVATGTALTAQVDAQLPSRILQSQLYFGWCSGTANGNSMTLVNQSTAGATVSSVLINEKTNAVTNPAFAAGNCAVTLTRNYFTYIVVANNGAFKSTRAYNLINSPNRLGLSTDGEQNACLPNTLGFNIGIDPDAGGIGDNWPLHTYSINWGDGSPVQIFRYCELIASGGVIDHPYTQNSCNQPNVSFTVTTSLINYFYVAGGTSTQQNCEQPVVTTRAKIFERPDASFTSDTIACVNIPVLFTNTTYPGYAQLGQSCVQNADYLWFVNGVLVQQFVAAFPPPNFTYTFTSPGRYEVRLIVDNGSCTTDEYFDSICVVPRPDPNFTMNGTAGNITGCSPLVITINNLTPTTDCSPTQYTWSILNNPSGTPANPANYTVVPNINAQNPTITFTGPGSYIVRLTATNYCSGTFVLDRIVTIIETADVTLPGNITYCDTRTINFATNGNHTPVYNTNAGTESYSWNITPASFTYVGGTSANSAYPQVQFNAYTTYTVTVTFTNPCGTDQATQQITFYQPTTADAGVDQSVCFSAASVNLSGSSSGPAGYTFNWSAVPGFGSNANISNTTIANPTYTLSPGDKSTGIVRLILTAVPPGGSVCPAVRDTIQITIYPDNNVTSAATATICSGTNLNYTITASVPGSTFSWTSSVISGAATGNTASGNTALINDVLTNSSNSVDAVVRYVITPIANGCNGNVFNLDVTVKALPQFTPTPSAVTLCSGDQLTINLASALGSAQYTWSSVVGPGTATGNTNQASPTATGSIVNTLTNTGTTDATITYTIIVYNPGTPTCTGETEQVVVTVRPPVNASASSNSPVCTGQTINLTGNSTTAGATYAWTGPNGFNSNAQSPAINNAIPANAGLYTLIATANGCPSPAATTTVVVNPSPVIGGASGTNPTSCATATGSITLTGLANNTTYTINYTFNGNPATPVSLNTNGSGSLVIPNLAAGIYDNITVTLSTCTSNPAGPITLSDPSAPNTPTAGSNSPICAGTTLNLNASTTSPGVATYAWSGPNGFSSNQQNPSISNATTAATGTYNVVVTISNCTSAAGSVSVVVNATPVTPTAGSNSPICTGATLNLTATTSTGGVTYAWTGPNTFTSSAQNPTINNVTAADAGLYSVTATIGSCISAAGTTTVVINTTPNISSTSTTNPTSCASATGSITLNGLANNTTYTVNYNFNGSPATPATIASNGSGSLVIPNLAAGLYDNIRVTVNGCTSNIVGPFTLSDPTPPATPTASSNSPVCSGLALNLSASTTTPGVATYTWSGPNAFTSNAQNPSIPNVTTAATGTYNVTVTISGCTSAAGSTSVTINQTPLTPVAGSNTPVCSGNTLNLTASTSTPGVMTWAWSGPNTFTSSSQNPNITNVTTAATGTYTVTATLGSCISAAGSTNVTVNPTPVIGGSGANNPANCATTTGSIVLTGLNVSTAYTVYYTQNGTPQTATISTNGSGNLTIPNLPAGSYTNVYVELNNCPSNIVGPFTLSDPTPPGVPLAGNNGPICSGNNLLLTANSATPGVTYTWSGPNGFSSNVQNPTIPNASTAATGTYNVTATLNGCTSAAGTTGVTVNQTPVAPTAGSNSPVCTTGTLNLTSSTPSAGVTYAWTGPNGFSNSNQNPTISNVTLADAGLYSVIVTSTVGSCPSTAGTTTVVINPTPNISGNILNNPTSCATSTGSIVLQGLTASTGYTVNYTQNGTPNSVGLSSDGSGNITIPNLPAGSYTNISVVLNGCTSNIVGPFTLSDPTPPAVPVTGSNSPICSGNTLNLTASSATPGVTYTWSGPNGFATNVQNPSITNAPVAATGVYSVTATLNSCTSAAGTVSVTVNPTPATPTAGSNAPVCSGGTINLTSNTSSPGVTYAWTGPNGFSNATQNPTISNVTLADAGIYSVIATTTAGSCPSAAGTTTVTINPTPNISGSSSTNPTNCASSTGTITLTGLVPNTTFTVNYTQGATPQTATLGTDATGALVIPNLPAGTYSNISVTLNNCPSNVVGPFTLVDPTPPATPIAGNNGPVCSGNTLNLTASTTSPGTATYAWTGPNGFTNNTQNPSITNVTVPATGIYSVSVTINSCTSAAGTTTVVVNQTPATPVASSNTPVCTDSTLNLTASTTTPGTMTWSWAGPNGFSSLVQNPVVPNITLAAAGTYTVIATATAGNCPSAPGSTSVVINPTPVITTTSFTNPINCNTATGSVTLNGLAASTAYTVLYNFNGNPQTANLSSGAGGSLVIPNLISGTYSNIRVVLTGCPSNIVGPITLTDPNPPATPTAGSNSPVCSGNDLNLTASTTSVGTITYTWSGPNGFSSVQQNPTIAAATLAANGIYSVTATLNGCVSAAGTVSVTVHETPATPVTGNNSPICADSTLNLTASTTFAGAVSWSWTGPNAFTSSSQNPSIIGATLAANGVYSVVATSTTGSCPSVAGTTTVVINPTPVISSASFTNPTQCLSSTGTIVLNGLAVSTAYTVTYTQNGNPVTTTITSDASGVVIIPNLPAGTYANIRVTTTAGCPSNTVGPFTLTDPNPPAQPVVGSNSPICTGETLNLTASTSTPGVITYSWTGPAGFTSNLQNPTIINATPGNSGTYTVTATLNNCVSPSNSVLVDVVALPAAPTVSSPVTYCVNTPSVPLTATPLPGNSLRWYTTSTGGVGSASAPTPSTGTVGVTSYYVSQVTPLGCEGVRALIEVVVNPDALAEFTYSPSTDCAPFNITSSVIQPILHPLQNSIYEWYADGVLIGTGTTFPGYTIMNAGDSVFIKLKTISLYGCRNDSAGTWFYTPPRPITNFTASDTVGCGPLSVTFTNTTPLIGAFSYNWNFGNGITSTAVNPGTIIFQPNPTAGDTIYHVSLTAFTQCDTITKVVDIRVKSKPKAIITPDKTYGCSPLTVTFSNISLGVNMTYEWNFGDGSASFFTNNNSPVQHTFNTGQQDTFYVRLIATNECGSDTGYYNVVVAAATIDLDVAHNGNQQTGCAPHTVTFYNHSTGATNFIWDFGDGNLLTTTNNIDTIVHTFQSVGTFNVFIRASNGCTDTTITENISVFARPNVNFTYMPAPVCVGDTIYFTNQSDTITGLLWTFDDGTTSQLTNPVHAYSSAGTYNVQLIGIRQYAPGNACTDTITYPVTVVASLPGVFTANVSGTCLPVTVTFTNHSLPSALTTWDFGNGAVDTGDIVTYTYTQVGTYTVTMTARDLNGCFYTHTMQINTSGPTGSFIYDHNYICGATPVRFEANVINTDSIRWDFGDGIITTSTGSVIYHVYNQPGIYVPTATLLGGGGTCSRLLTGIDTIKVDYVSAGFTANQTRSCGSTLVAFSDTSRSYFGVNAWEWTFGDGGGSNIKNPVHPYTTTNTWPIRLIATSASGCKDTTDVPLFIKVDALPTASIVHPPTGCVNDPVTYNSVVISQDPVTYYSWTFSNLATGNTPTVQNNYAAPGVYTAQLIAGTSFGCYDTVTSNITINPSPFVNTNPDMQICRGQSAHLNATGGLNYTWAPFTGLSCTTCQNPIASPLTTTQYVVTGYNSFGCAGRDTILITVPQPIDVLATPPVTLCIGQSIQLNATGANTYVWSPATGLSATNIPNPTANPTVTTIYRVIGFDAHNCFQDTAYVPVGVGNYPVVNVGRDTILATGSQVTLTPTATQGPIGLWSWNPSTDLSCANCPAPVATAKKDICYTVTATNLFGCSGKDTMCIRVFCEGSQVFIPNAFTPDADGINDMLTVKGKGIKTVKMFRIFNRWGQLVFEKSNFQPNIDSYGWNGRVNGIPAPPDVYVYTCEVVCEDDTPYTYKGNVAILK